MPLWTIPIAIVSLATACVLAWYVLPRAYRMIEVARLRARCRRLRAVCLTYDDGPGDALTHAIMDLIEAHGGHATFLMLGARTDALPELAAEAFERGHEVGSHTHEHLNAWRTSPARAASDIDRGIESIESRTGRPGPFRPPYGRVTLASWIHMLRRGKHPVWWTHDSGDTHRELPSPQNVVQSLERDGGGVVLMHDFDQHRSPERTRYVLEVTRHILEWARSADVKICTYEQLGR